MLENRPVVKKSLIGVGAFSFVFTAAMAGTGFMISGGFGLGDNSQLTPSFSDYVPVLQAGLNDFAPPASAATPVYVTTAPVADPAPAAEILYQPESTAYGREQGLAGEARTAQRDRVQARTEEDILRDIERELATYAPPAPSAYRDLRPAFDPDVIAAKEQAETRAPYEY